MGVAGRLEKTEGAAMKQYEKMSIQELLREDGFLCSCGKRHYAGVEQVYVEENAIARLPGLMRDLGLKRPFLLSDVNTWKAAGERVARTLDEAGISHAGFCFQESHVEPDERAVGLAAMKFDPSCDLIVGVGSGVINDIGKILSSLSGREYMVVATAPSMDGYASATSSMALEGLKVSVNSRAPRVILGDLTVLCQAPMHMIQSGIGDMLAKYVSICEWRIAHLLVGESYCETVAALVRRALQKCVSAAPGLKARDPRAIAAVMEGLTLSGVAMKYAGLSRPASGVEHYFSHVWDMRTLAFGTPGDLHGIQCALGTLLALRAYEEVRQLKPDREKALAYVASFDPERWNERLRAFIGPGAEAMIRGEQREGKYDRAKHAARLEKILDGWPEILRIMDEELPSYDAVRELLELLGAPTDPAQIGLSPAEVRETFPMTKDIRDKYVVTRLLWDLGELDEVGDRLFGSGK